MAPYSEFVDAAMENISELSRNRSDAFSQQESNDIEDQIRNSIGSLIEMKTLWKVPYFQEA